MNFSKVMDLIAKNDIDPNAVLGLVEKIKNSDLQDEDNIRSIIKEASKIANKELSTRQEDDLVKKILSDGIDDSVFDLI